MATKQDDYNEIVKKSINAFKWWRDIPAPQRGELIRIYGNVLREELNKIGNLVTKESRKIKVEGVGEVQEAIDMCDFAVGLSRQLYGLTMPSERPEHRLQELWQPLGPVGVITAFNFPVAPWAWNFCLAIVCGNPVIWKPSDKTEECAKICLRLWKIAVEEWGIDERAVDLLKLVLGGKKQAEWIADDSNIKLVSATGSVEMGKALSPRVAKRLGKILLELGGNNAAIVSNKANLDLAVRACTFSAVGTAGQRCTTLRRVFVHRDVYTEFVDRLIKAYTKIVPGDPENINVLMGPLISKESFDAMHNVISECKQAGYIVHGGERVLPAYKLGGKDEYYVSPAIVELEKPNVYTSLETFAPILYVMPYQHLRDAIEMQNNVSQGLSSCIFTTNMQEMEHFISAHGSDCGIANVNIGPSGAEIGGAFGGEKDTGGGRESGSDAWKSYMRRQTVTINYGDQLPLAQGIKFDV
jgi:aldehyde dehydrogenase (NAD+)